MTHYRVLSRMAAEFAHPVRVVDISPTRWLQHCIGDCDNTTQLVSANHDKPQYAAIWNSYNASPTCIIRPQLESQQFHIDIGCHVLRTFTEYLTPSIIKSQQQLQNILQSSIHTAYHRLDSNAKTIEGIFGQKPVEMAATIGPLLYETNDKDILRKEYTPLLETLATLDIIWIQNIPNLVQLEIVMEVASKYKNEEQIWISLDRRLLANGACDLFDLLSAYKPGAIIVVDNDWTVINTNLVLCQQFTELEGGTKFGVIVSDSTVQRDANDLMHENNPASDAFNALWKENMGELHDKQEWNAELLKKASAFWIEQGVSIIGCEWIDGLKVVQKQAQLWNEQIAS